MQPCVCGITTVAEMIVEDGMHICVTVIPGTVTVMPADQPVVVKGEIVT